ncbi:MAG: hypothetical protein K0B10_14325, partial [Vicingaceae bacterium]|nr:hypothetical protein [Vicingaceae bacterium]
LCFHLYFFDKNTYCNLIYYPDCQIVINILKVVINGNLINRSPHKLEYESKGFMESKLIQDFPLRGKGVYLRIKIRRWRHKQTGAIIKRDFSFLAEGSKFTKELSDFLKDTGRYKT